MENSSQDFDSLGQWSNEEKLLKGSTQKGSYCHFSPVCDEYEVPFGAFFYRPKLVVKVLVLFYQPCRHFCLQIGTLPSELLQQVLCVNPKTAHQRLGWVTRQVFIFYRRPAPFALPERERKEEWREDNGGFCPDLSSPSLRLSKKSIKGAIKHQWNNNLFLYSTPRLGSSSSFSAFPQVALGGPA